MADPGQNTGLRVSLPKPNCVARPSDCADIDVINTLDGFNLQPRLSIPFDGAIDVSTVNSQTVFLMSLGSTRPGGAPGGKMVGIDQIVWDPATDTVHAEADEFLDQQFGGTLDYFIQAVFNVNLNRLETSMACSKATTPRGALRGHPESRLTPPS